MIRWISTLYNTRITLSNPVTYFGGLLFMLMLCAPFEFVTIKIILIATVLLSVVVYSILYKTLNLTAHVLLWVITWIAWGVFFSIIGTLNPQTPQEYVLRALPVNVVWPIVYTIFIIGIDSKEKAKLLIRIAIISVLIISLYTIGAMLNILGLVSIPFISFSMATQALDLDEGLIKIFVPSTTSLLFLIPFLFTLILLDAAEYLGFKKIHLYIILFTSVVAVLATARRALLLNIFIAPVILFVLVKYSGFKVKSELRKQIKKSLFYFIVVLTLVLLLVMYLGILDVGSLVTKFINGFQFDGSTEDEGSNLRSDQFGLLFRSFLDSPIFGAGHGAESQYVTRSEATPWVYELSYLALLFQTGIVGLSIYFYLLYWIFKKGSMLIPQIHNEYSVYMLASLVGLTSFLLANATNPYLIAYDHMWVLFLPLSLINLLSKRPAHE